MKKFDEQLLRLKSLAGVASDQEIAALLGLSKAALSDRKKRDAFPLDKLKALAMDRPDLNIDVIYVMTGDYTSVYQAKEMLATQSVVGADPKNSQGINIREQALLQHFRKATEEGKKAIEATAKALAREGSDK